MKKVVVFLILLSVGFEIQAQEKPNFRFQVETQSFFALYARKQMNFDANIESRDRWKLNTFISYSPVDHFALAFTLGYHNDELEYDYNDQISSSLAIGFYNSRGHSRRGRKRKKSTFQVYYDLYIGIQNNYYNDYNHRIINSVKYFLQGSYNLSYKWSEFGGGLKLNLVDYYKVYYDTPIYDEDYTDLENMKSFAPTIYPEINLYYRIAHESVGLYIQASKMLAKKSPLIDPGESITIGGFLRIKGKRKLRRKSGKKRK